MIINPEQIKSVTDNTGAFSPDSADIRYSLADLIPGSQTVSDAFPEAFGPVDKPSGPIKDWIVTQVFDRMYPLKKMVRLAGEEGVDITGVNEMLSANLGIHGFFKHFIEEGTLKVVLDDNGRKTLSPGENTDSFAKLQRDIGNNVEQGRFFAYMINQRHKNSPFPLLKGEVLKAIEQAASEYVVNQEHIDRFRKIHKSMVDIAVDMGFISKELADKFDYDFYIPMHRVMQEEHAGADGQGNPLHLGTSTIKHNIKKIVGSGRKLGDPVMNILKSWDHLLSGAIKNNQRAELHRVMTAFQGTTSDMIIERVDEKDAGKPGVLGHSVNGELTHYKVYDDAIYQALVGKPVKEHGKLWQIMFAGPARLLRAGIVNTPEFAVRNFVRDAMQTSVMERSFRPWDSLRGLMKIWRNDPIIAELTAAGLSFDRYSVPQDKASMDKYMKRVQGKGVYNPLNSKPWQWYQKLLMSMEMSARVELASKLKTQGLTTTEAVARARDLLDFQMRGDSDLLNTITTLIPFSNARIQGFRSLVVAAKRDPNYFYKAGATMALATAMLWMRNRDDERWQRLPEYERAMYWHFWIGEDHFRIPKPHELGSLFGTGTETFLESNVGDRDFEYAMAMLGNVANGALKVDPPTFMKVPIEMATNYDMFRGKPIVGMGQQRMLPEAQWQPWTPDTAVRVGETLGASPLMVEHAFKGFLGNLGDYIMIAGDALMGAAHDSEKPTRRPEDGVLLNAFLGGMVQPGERTANRYYIELNRTMKEINDTMSTIRYYSKTGNHDKARALHQKQERLVRLDQYRKNVEKKIRAINKQVKAVYNSSMKPEQKRLAIDKLLEQRESVSRQVAKVLESLD